jgi:hypothetical protein
MLRNLLMPGPAAKRPRRRSRSLSLCASFSLVSPRASFPGFPSRSRKGPNSAAVVVAVSLCLRVAPLYLRASPRACARAPTLAPSWLRFPCVCGLPLSICGLPLALARGPRPCPLRGRSQTRFRSPSPMQMRENSAEIKPVKGGSPRPRPGGNPENEMREQKRASVCCMNKPGFPSRFFPWFPLALARGPQLCRRRGCGFPVFAGCPSLFAGFPSRLREGPDRAPCAADHKPDSARQAQCRCGKTAQK